MPLHKNAIKTELFAHQRDVLEKSCDKINFALLMEQGTGKTKVALDTIAHLYLSRKITGALIIAPSGVDENWFKELYTHLSSEIKDVICFQYKSSKSKNRVFIESKNNFLKQRYGFLHFATMIPESILTENGAQFAREFLKKFDCIFVIDESGKVIKNHKAARTKELVKIGILAKYRRILTGTPVTKSPLDLYAQFAFLDQKILSYNNYFSFRNQYAETQIGFGGARNYVKVIGYKNLDDLIDKISPHAFRVLKKDCLDLPPKVYSKMYYELSGKQASLYRDLLNDDVAFPGTPNSEHDLFTLISDNKDMVLADNALKKLLRLQQIVDGYVVCEDGNVKNIFTESSKNPRIKLVDQILEDAGEKVIIWARFRHEIAILLAHYGKISLGYYGDMSQEERVKSAAQFKTDGNIRILIANQSMGYGWTMNEATTVIYFSNDFNLENRLQSEDRCHRAGQKNPVTYFDIIADNTVDEHILRNLTQKMEFSVMLDTINK